MRQLSCTAPGVVEWCEVPAPTLVEPTDALVRPIAVSSVTVASSDDTVLALAEHIGADPLPTDFGDRPKTTRPIVVDCGVEPTGLQWAVRATEPEGVLHSVSSYAAEATVPMPLRRLYTLGIEFHIGRAHSAALLPRSWRSSRVIGCTRNSSPPASSIGPRRLNASSSRP